MLEDLPSAHTREQDRRRGAVQRAAEFVDPDCSKELPDVAFQVVVDVDTGAAQLLAIIWAR